MKIRNRLTLISSLTFGIVFTIASALVYLLFYTNSQQAIYKELESFCMLTALFYLEEDELPQREHKIIRTQFEETIANMEVRVYAEDNTINYGFQTPDPVITNAILDKVRGQELYHFKGDDAHYAAIFYPDNQGDFVVVVKRDNTFLIAQLNRLLLILAGVLCLGLLAIIVLSRALSNIAYRPVARVIEQINTIEPGSIHQKISTPESRDEIQALVETFNDMLGRLSETFAIQRNFINYVSHEIKTPLAAISGSLEVFAQKNRTPEEYEHVASMAIRNVDEIRDILDTMMILSGLKKKDTLTQNLRLDELLWEIMDKAEAQYPDQRISVQIDVPQDKIDVLKFRGVKMEMLMALYNLIDNALKYSNGKGVDITIKENAGHCILQIRDFGKGIPDSELQNIHKPFYRGNNVRDTKGSGIGMAVAGTILNNNNVRFDIRSELDKGTTVDLVFPAD